MEPGGVEPPRNLRISRGSREFGEARSAGRSAVCTGAVGGAGSRPTDGPIGERVSPTSRTVAAGGDAPRDHDLARLAAAWADLPPDVRSTIVAALDVNR